VRHAVRFYAVGAAGAVVQLAALALFKGGLGLNLLAATALAVEAAVLHNFLWHERWTWRDRGLAASGWSGRLLRFHLSNGILSIGANLLLMAALTGWMRVEYLAANAISISLCAVLNYLAADRIVFRSDPARAGSDRGGERGTSWAENI
jgi:putative flippase GtrA